MQTSRQIIHIYIALVLTNTIAISLIWGINTIFLLDAGLSNFEAFLANAFFTVGQVLFEIPTGIIADTYGRRISYLLGAFTLMVSTLMYVYMWNIHGPFIGWALSSVLLGLGFTFFSGATEAWLVDALHTTNFKGSLESVFAKGQVTGGIAMLAGSVAGGVIAETTTLGVPYLIRIFALSINIGIAFFFMKDIGFEQRKMTHPLKEMKLIFTKSVHHGFGNPPVRWLMLAAPFTMSVSFYIFYALQPFLLELYGDKTAYSIAGIMAALMASAQIVGGVLTSYIRRLFHKRTNALVVCIGIAVGMLGIVSLVQNFIVVLILIFLWGLMSAALMPIRQSYLNGNIPSEQRATVLSFDSLVGSSGGIIIQPILGRVADIYSYSTSYFIAACIQLGAIPFILLARKEDSPSDTIT